MIPHVDESKGVAEYGDQKKNEVTWKHQLLLNRPLKVIIMLLLTSVVAPLLIYKYIFYTSEEIVSADGYSFGSCLVPRESRLLCGTEDVTETNCDPQCCYDLVNKLCFHRFPSRFTYLTPRGQEWNESTILRPRIDKIPYKSQESIQQIKISFDEISSTHLSFVIYDSQQRSVEGKRIEYSVKKYTYEVQSPELNIVINGSTGNNTLFTTLRGPLIASDDIWETSFKLTDESMYGLGEIPLKANMTKVFYNHVGESSSIPLIFAKAGNDYHGLLIDILEPTQLSVIEDNRVVVRSITRTGLKFHLFVGPRPEDILEDVTDLIGKSELYKTYDTLEYWMLGTHICNDISAAHTTSYNNLKDFLSKSSEENLPFDSHCGAHPIVFKNEIEHAQNHSENESELLQQHRKRFVPHVSPYISYDGKYDHETTESKPEVKSNDGTITDKFEGFFMRDPDGTIYIGNIDDNNFVYPDYENVSTEFIETLWPTDSKVHGFVLENTWPLDQSVKDLSDMYNSLPYFDKTFAKPFEVTPKWNIDRPGGNKYIYGHNAYGNNFAEAITKLTEDNLPIWTSSQWMNGKIVVNIQNVNASWANLHKVLTEAALGGISGHRLWSTPVCGDTELFNPDSQSSLCVKWYMAATYLPMIRIESKSVERHPLAFKGTNRNYIDKALADRMSLLPYYFSTLQEGPLLRPMFYQFPSSENLKDLTTQFSVGEDLLIVPNLLPSQSQVRVWIPPGTWYELWSGFELSGNEGQAITMTTTEADLLTLIRGGSIVPLQRDVKSTSEETRLHSNFSLIIALRCDFGEIGDKSTCKAFGHVYINPVMSITFSAGPERIYFQMSGYTGSLELLCDANKAIWAHVIKELYIYGLAEEFNNHDHHRKVTANIDLCVLETEMEIVFSYIT